MDDIENLPSEADVESPGCHQFEKTTNDAESNRSRG
jgi:hypothetical protein